MSSQPMDKQSENKARQPSGVFRRFLVSGLAGGVLFVSLICAALAAVDQEEYARWIVGFGLSAGGIMSFIVYLHWVDEGPSIPAFLAASLVAQAGVVLGGVSFLMVALAEAWTTGTVTVKPSVLVIISYGCWGAFGSSAFALGAFLWIGFGRKWVDLDVQKAFWRRGDSITPHAAEKGEGS